MKYETEKLKELQLQLKGIIKAVETGKLDKGEAAEKIIEVREQMDRIITSLRSKASKGK